MKSVLAWSESVNVGINTYAIFDFGERHYTGCVIALRGMKDGDGS
jgi:hypothetical protein